MPLFIPPLIAVLIEWGTAALASYGLASLFSNESVSSLVARVEGWLVAKVAERTGLHLNPDDPLSDASFSAAISEKIGITVRSLKNRDTIREDLDEYMRAQLEAKTGYSVRSVMSVDLLREDLMHAGAAELTARLGIPVGVSPGDAVPFDVAAIRARVLTWAKAEFLTQFEGEMAAAVAEISQSAGVEAMVAQVNGTLSELGSVERLTARQLAVRVSEMMATNAVAEFHQVARGMEKKNRRRESLRAAQAKFRRLHGNRQVYIPLGQSGFGVPP